MPAASQPGAPAAPAPRLVRRLDWLPDPERAFVHLYGASRNAFWLDSSAAGGERGRFSFIGDDAGGAVVTYEVGGQLRVERGGEVEQRRESVFAYLDRECGAGEPLGGAAAELPFDFRGGLAGYLGYELKAECDSPNSHRSPLPDAALIRPARLIAFDHLERHTYLLAHPAELHQIPAPPELEFDAVRRAGERWLDETEARLAALPELGVPRVPDGAPGLGLARSPERYLADVAACRDYLHAGHSYEICLTNSLRGPLDADPLELYRALRRVNPAPFAAYLRFGERAVLSSSPERFLAVDRGGWAEARPIKGTARRSPDPAEDAALAAALAADPKSRAENVTIVDLLRNDLGRVCEVGSVHVPELMAVETYETVHQLVSGVRGRLRAGVGPGEAIRACFPPGSMTGAPKLRTMEILEELEGGPRGVYSGAIGWLGPGGACDLSVAIRTIVLDRGAATIGAGGAIVADSEPEAELAEMLLKAAAPAAALGGGTSISSALRGAGQARRDPSPTPS